MGLISLVIVGLLAGFIARFLVPGRDPLSIVGTLILGVVGSLIGGFLGYVLFDKEIGDGAFQASGIIGSIIGAVIALIAYRVFTSRRVAA